MRNKIFLVLAATAALSAGAASAQDTAGTGVTFMNETQRPITFTAKAVSGDDCLAGGELEKLNVDAGQTSQVASGSDNVCYCLGDVRRNSCTTGWTFAKAGSKIRLR